ncbi:MAG: hypothetical protein HUK25_04070, partial [Treponema sp.]|nr:hypothetical protein [Treponema sp.]
DGAKQVTYRLTDTYGRTTETDIAYTVDTTAPSVNNANVTVGIKDKTAVKVGSLASTWFNSPSLIITVPEGAVTDLNLKSEVNYVQGTDEGKFQMTVSNTEPKKGTFSNTRSFSEGTSSVKYTFVDEAGNTNDLEITGIKVDTAAPSVSKTKKADNTDIDYITIDATDGIGKVTVKLTAKDATSGVKTVMLGSKINFSDSEKLCSDITVSGTSYNATKELNFNEKVGTEYKYKEGTQHIWARVIDEAGNKCADVELGTIEIDRTDPVVTISAVKDADSEKDGIQVNKTITISGTASDANASTKVPELKVYKFDSTQEKNKGAEQTATGLITAVSGSTFASWSYKVDTEKLTDETDYLFEVTAEDKSKNYGTASVKLFVSQNTDRPQIVL